MTPEEKARQLIDARLVQSGWVVQGLKKSESHGVTRRCGQGIPHQHRAG